MFQAAKFLYRQRNRLLLTLFLSIGIFLALGCFARAAAQAAPDPGWNDLLSEGLSNWKIELHPRLRNSPWNASERPFAFSEGILHVNGKVGNIGFLRYAESFCDFELESEFRGAEGANNGICFRAPVYQKETPAHTGYELQILFRDGAGADSATGALYSVNPSLAAVSLTTGAWHRARIVAKGTRIQAWIDDTLVQDYHQTVKTETKDRPLCGFISIQNHGGDTDFRNFRVRPIN